MNLTMLKNILLFTVLILAFSSKALAYICQPSNANGFDGYSDEVLYNGFYLYNAKSNDYKAYQIVQNKPGEFQQEYYCIYKTVDEKNQHINSCDNFNGTRNTCQVFIGGYIDGVTNFSPYLDGLDQGDCDSGPNVCFDIPQTLVLSNGTSSYNAETGIHEANFYVTSNGWLNMEFKGFSYDVDGQTSSLPLFYKPIVDINKKSTGKFDLLPARYGVRVLNTELLKETNANGDFVSTYNWQLGPKLSVSPSGPASDLILPFSDSRSPGNVIGAFTPAIGGNRYIGDSNPSQVQVFAQQLFDQNSQSGEYYMNIQIEVTAYERP